MAFTARLTGCGRSEGYTVENQRKSLQNGYREHGLWLKGPMGLLSFLCVSIWMYNLSLALSSLVPLQGPGGPSAERVIE